jgi:hypothetical protein
MGKPWEKHGKNYGKTLEPSSDGMAAPLLCRRSPGPHSQTRTARHDLRNAQRTAGNATQFPRQQFPVISLNSSSNRSRLWALCQSFTKNCASCSLSLGMTSHSRTRARCWQILSMYLWIPQASSGPLLPLYGQCCSVQSLPWYQQLSTNHGKLPLSIIYCSGACHPNSSPQCGPYFAYGLEHPSDAIKIPWSINDFRQFHPG